MACKDIFHIFTQYIIDYCDIPSLYTLCFTAKSFQLDVGLVQNKLIEIFGNEQGFIIVCEHNLLVLMKNMLQQNIINKDLHINTLNLALNKAIQNNHKQVIKRLIDLGANDQENIFVTAAKFGYLDVIENSIKQKKPSEKILNQAILEAAKNGHYVIEQYLEIQRCSCYLCQQIKQHRTAISYCDDLRRFLFALECKPYTKPLI